MNKKNQQAARKLEKLGERLRSGFEGQSGYPAKEIALFMRESTKQLKGDIGEIYREQEKRRKKAEAQKAHPAPKPKEHERKGED